MPRLFRRIVAALGAALLPAAAAMAQVGADGARILSTTDAGRGFEAVGRLDLGQGSFCTGALIAPDQVLTAAHCLFDPASGARIAPGDITFLAGWRNGRAAAYRGARRVAVHPAYVPASEDALAHVPHDLAVIELDRPIRLPQMQPFAIAHAARPGERVSIVSYARAQAEAPALQEMCDVLDNDRRVLVLSCPVDFGASGAPVFAAGAGGAPQIVSVVSAKAELEQREVALGTALRDEIATLHQALANGRVPSSGPSAAAGDTRPEIGARFIRP
ncbi:trypsin-like serine peptidase [Alkalilacustris brevis]|uniref:trypsin-like serine peptidase n=1 Tax=Alkalilacustris brevis TaxID=2026338 RepID=UPI000E0CE1B1|nr:trypsin-like peptidase domain-containing protein [Alkalilacustris brevis]